MKTSKALRLAKKNLWDGQDLDKAGFGSREFICHAAKDAGPLVQSIVCPLVVDLLGHKPSLAIWLEDYGYADTPWRDMPKLQATREAWLDHLIAHYKAKGD